MGEIPYKLIFQLWVMLLYVETWIPEQETSLTIYIEADGEIPLHFASPIS